MTCRPFCLNICHILYILLCVASETVNSKKTTCIALARDRRITHLWISVIQSLVYGCKVLQGLSQIPSCLWELDFAIASLSYLQGMKNHIYPGSSLWLCICKGLRTIPARMCSKLSSRNLPVKNCLWKISILGKSSMGGNLLSRGRFEQMQTAVKYWNYYQPSETYFSHLYTFVPVLINFSMKFCWYSGKLERNMTSESILKIYTPTEQKKKPKNQSYHLTFLNVLQSNVSWHKDKVWYLVQRRLG